MFAIQPRVLRSSGLAQGVLTMRYALAPDKTFDLIIQPGSTRPHNRGLIGLMWLAMANHDNHVRSVANTRSTTNSSSQTMTAIFSTTPVDLRRVVKTSWTPFKNLSNGNRKRNDWKTDYMRSGLFLCESTLVNSQGHGYFSGIAFRRTMIGHRLNRGISRKFAQTTMVRLSKCDSMNRD